MVLNHAFSGMTDKMVRSGARNLPVSTKACIMICQQIRGMKIVDAKRFLDDVVAHKRPIVYTRFTDGVGHRPGKIASGRYPEKAVLAVRKLLVNLENNAQQKGLGEDLQIIFSSANKGVHRGRFGRQSRRTAKATHLDMVAAQVVVRKVVPKTTKKTPQKVEAKEEK